MRNRSNDKQLQFLKQSAQLEEYVPVHARKLHQILCGLVFLFIVWMVYTPVEEFTLADGEVVPAGFSQIVDYSHDGSVEAILVSEGDWVEQGQELLRLDPVGIEESLKRAKIDADAAQSAVTHTEKLLSIQKKLRDKGYATAWEILKLEQTLTQNQRDLLTFQQNIQELSKRYQALRIVAPVDGWIKELTVNTIGQAIKAGEAIAEIIPAGKQLVVEARIAPHDIGHVRTGQSVRVKITAFDAYRFGTADGRIEFITPATLTDPNGQTYYRARIHLLHGYLGTNTQLKILPGMQVQASILTGRKTVFTYLLKPIQRAFESSLSEK